MRNFIRWLQFIGSILETFNCVVLTASVSLSMVPEISEGDRGYVNVRYVREGVSQWYDGEKMHVYKYTNVVFLKFIKEPNKVNKEFLID